MAGQKINGNGKHPDKMTAIRDYRCVCGRLLFRGILATGTKIEVRCWHRDCHRMNTFPRQLVIESMVESIDITDQL